ncbi:MAG: radical SAM protein [Nitrososphaerota archaeon]
MSLDTCFSLKFDELRPLIEKAWEITRANFPEEVHFYFPGMIHIETSFYTPTNVFRFPGISVTGAVCKLQCEHCKGLLLRNMLCATTPETLFDTCLRVKEAGGTGCLVTGGSLEDGSVPIKRFIPVIKRIKDELGLHVVVHTGLVNEELAEGLAYAGVDAAMIDVLGSDETIRDVLKLNKTVADYERSLDNLEKYRVPIVPHIVVGIHYGQILGERKAVEIISKHKTKALVVVALMPIADTPMENVSPPSPIDVMRVVLFARFLMPNTPIMLGCARPRGALRSAMDVLALRVGVNGIAYPSEEAYRFARRLGLNVVVHDDCCSLIWRDMAPKV